MPTSTCAQGGARCRYSRFHRYFAWVLFAPSAPPNSAASARQAPGLPRRGGWAHGSDVTCATALSQELGGGGARRSWWTDGRPLHPACATSHPKDRNGNIEGPRCPGQAAVRPTGCATCCIAINHSAAMRRRASAALHKHWRSVPAPDATKATRWQTAYHTVV